MKHPKKQRSTAPSPSRTEREGAAPHATRGPSDDADVLEDGGAANEFVDPEADAPEVTDEVEPTLVRLNKYLADHGIASRRKCDELIVGGQVTIDGEVTTELGRKIDPTRHTVEIDGFILKPAGLRKRYYLLNKPSGVVCTNEPRETRPRAVDLITDARKGRIYTVGRLDEESKGLILLTNDGDFANRIMHPRYGVEKTYLVRVAGKIDDEALTKVREGVHLAEGRTAGARVLVNKRVRDQSTLTLTLREGMNREIRRSFAQVGFKVLDLRRTNIGPLSDRGIKIGRWRELTREEVAALLAGRNESLDIRDEAKRGARERGGMRRHGHGHTGKPFGDRGHAHSGGPVTRRPKVRSGWRVFDERARSHDAAKRNAGHTDHGRGARAFGPSHDASPRKPSRVGDRRGSGPRGGGERSGARGPGSPRRGGGGPQAHARRKDATHARRPVQAGARSGARSSVGQRSGKPSSHGTRRRG